jgi:hypothetical protein
MQKIDSLRAAITAALPEYKAAPKKLLLWVDRGTGHSRQTATFGFGFKFRINIMLLDFSADIGALVFALFMWMRVNQPNLLDPGTDGIEFDVDFLDNAKADLVIKLDLKQNVSVKPNEAKPGTFLLDYLTEPEPMFLDDLPSARPIPPCPSLPS